MTDVPQPALATLSHDRFWEDGWIYERKLDGQLCLAVRQKTGTRLYSRTGRDVTPLRAAGEDLRAGSLLDRKRRLRALLGFGGPVRYTPHRVTGGEEWFAEICGKGWEGLIAKRVDAAYATGRTDRWLKFKCESGQELVIVGWTDPEGARVALGALLLGYWDKTTGDLVYAGKVGTGFSQSVLRDLHARLSELEVSDPPCTRGRLPTKAVHWARPQLVAEVAFTEWTTAGQLRHPRYLGLRTDKPARDVVRE